jgi:Domain of unknown function (DUF4360)
MLDFGTVVTDQEKGSAQASTNQTFTGPTAGAYNYNETIPADSNVWSPCNSPLPLNVNNQIRLMQDSGSMGSGVLYDSGVLDLALQWRACDPATAA